MTILGLDIGGANIKAADAAGRAICRSFAIWREPERLTDEIASILREFPQTDRVALTMTAELADCFSTKAEGVRFILDAVENCLRTSFLSGKDAGGNPLTLTLSPQGRGEGTGSQQRANDVTIRGPSSDAREKSPQGRGEGIRVVAWSVDGRFVFPADARGNPIKVAAANWHALATWCGQFAPVGSGLLVDIGTTTTDVIPLLDGKPIPDGLTDVTRLQSGELSYSGVKRTPLCAIAQSVPFQNGYCSLAAELFATTLDVYLLLGDIVEDEGNLETANGKPATKVAAHDRIARLLCCDREEVSFDEAVGIARFLADVQRQRLAGSLERVANRLPSECQTVILSGSGSFLARQLVAANRHTMNGKVISLADQLSPGVSEAACAYAIARLASLTS